MKDVVRPAQALDRPTRGECWVGKAEPKSMQVKSMHSLVIMSDIIHAMTELERTREIRGNPLVRHYSTEIHPLIGLALARGHGFLQLAARHSTKRYNG